MRISNNVSSRKYNSFGLDVSFKTLIDINSKDDLFQLSKLSSEGFKFLGGDSNVLLTKDLNKPLILMNNKGLEVIKDQQDYVLVNVAAGENWHDVVLWAVQNNFGGIENLSLIPGKSGAAPIQNIGAYGVEIKDVLHAVKAFNIAEEMEYTFHNQECQFAYRNSLFKTKWKDQFIITEIILKLTKSNHRLNTSYGAIEKRLETQKIKAPSIKDVSDAVIHIRQSKLPDPKKIGNAGSFFKNPLVDKSDFERLKRDFENMPHYPANDRVKLAAGWLIDQCGWKGKVIGQSGTYKNQALVLVNRGAATGQEIYDLSSQIQKDVALKFGVVLEREVNVW